MYRSLSLWIVLAVLLAAPRALPAQSPEFHLEPGERIEIAAPTLDPRLVPATVTHWEPTWVGFSTDDGQVWTRHMHHVEQVRVLRRVPLGRRLRAGAAWGLFVGASLGGIASPFAARGIDRDIPEGTLVGGGLAIGGAVGAGVGALIGALVPRRLWTHYVFQGSARQP